MSVEIDVDIADIARMPAWVKLGDWVDAERERWAVKAAKALLRGDALDPVELAYKRGVFDGQKALIAHADRVAKAEEATVQAAT